jgi:hypothetical protein
VSEVWQQRLIAALRGTIPQRVQKNRNPLAARLAGSKSEGGCSLHPSPEVQPPQSPKTAQDPIAEIPRQSRVSAMLGRKNAPICESGRCQETAFK